MLFFFLLSSTPSPSGSFMFLMIDQISTYLFFIFTLSLFGSFAFSYDLIQLE